MVGVGKEGLFLRNCVGSGSALQFSSRRYRTVDQDRSGLAIVPSRGSAVPLSASWSARRAFRPACAEQAVVGGPESHALGGALKMGHWKVNLQFVLL